MSSATTDATLANQYQRKTDKQHILDNPDTYIGSVAPTDESLWVFDIATQRIAMRNMEHIPGLYKLFDEGIVNCRDHVIRMLQSTAENKKCVSYISVEITEEGEIILENDGDGIDVAKHPEYDLWIPEMVFGHLRTSTNYDKTEQKIVGGKNGFGFKLALIWSTRGAVETVDAARGLRYTQSFGANLSTIALPTIVSVNKKDAAKPFTRVSFLPDYERLGIPGLSPDMIALFRKRAYDICATTCFGDARKVKVSFNGEQLAARTFQQYVDLYIGAKINAPRVYESGGERWEYAVALSPSHQFEQVSFVNGVCTTKGGKHVDYILGQLTRKLVAYIEKKKKIAVAPATIREQLFVFLRCDINNPSFDSQTKDCLTTPSNAFGSTCAVSDTFIEKIAKMGIMEQACALSEIKDARKAKKNDGAKTRTVRGIANFVDANHAGGTGSGACTLILCEGLSAMSGVISGLSSDDRNIIGVYPLKGKLLNVRGEAVKRIAENKEITDLKRIMGLELKREYTSLADVHTRLRYGKIMILTDADTDGSHIKALCINLFHSEWPSLFRIPGFLSFMNTPILTARKGNTKILFYNEGEHAVWKTAMGGGSASTGAIPGWTMKYFKGLGTSTEIEFKQYFKAKKTVDFEYSGAGDDDCIDMVFNKKRANERKTWLGTYDRAAYLDTTVSKVQYAEFVDRELIHFSVYDCERSIPSMVDGLKISQRKILFAAFKRNMTTEIKVAQFSGYVSEKACYHHGEASLNGAIVNMAQTFVGANNVNLLVPSGQFGSRLQGGKDSASERYIFTYLHPIARAIFRKEDDAILKYLEDDGTAVEPEFYLPIVPMVLVNGAIGIGTGFSTSIPQYDLRDIVAYLKSKLGGDGEHAAAFVPWYRGFTGSVLPLTDEKFAIKGVYTRTNENAIRITELPIGTWTMPYISFLEKLEDGSVDADGKRTAPAIKSFTSNSTDRVVDIEVIFLPGTLAQMETHVDSAGVNGVQKLLGLTTTVSITNMHLFDSALKLQQYDRVEDIIAAFFEVRYRAYATRKTYLEAEMAARLTTLSNKARYIELALTGEVDLRHKTNVCIDEMLALHDLARENDTYNYLTRMPMSSVSKENAAALLAERDDVAEQLEIIRITSVETTWLRELNELENVYIAMLAEMSAAAKSANDPAPKSRTVVARKKRAV